MIVVSKLGSLLMPQMREKLDDNLVKSEKIAQDKKRIEEEERKLKLEGNKLLEDFYNYTTRDEILNVLTVIEKNGHPSEIIEVKEIREKYNNGELAYNEIDILDVLVKSNISYFKNEE